MVDQGLALARVLLSDTTKFSSSMRPLTQKFTKVHVSTHQLESHDLCFYCFFGCERRRDWLSL